MRFRLFFVVRDVFDLEFESLERRSRQQLLNRAYRGGPDGVCLVDEQHQSLRHGSRDYAPAACGRITLVAMDDLTPRLDAIKAKFEHVKEYL